MSLSNMPAPQSKLTKQTSMFAGVFFASRSAIYSLEFGSIGAMLEYCSIELVLFEST